ncbi:MAG: uroporphyrinogen decarboxylase [Candidatus Hydrogenedentes bacterium]|nr:uroporphyrinogen decarboxylase [Candidatus Hydrogenedentota bacterium]
MTQDQWEELLAIIRGENLSPLPVGFIIDSPWLPNWHGASLLDYFSDNEYWFQANLAAVKAFPQVLFLPGFWAEYGMCSEPASFGAKCSFYENEFPFAHPLSDALNSIRRPDPRTDGLTPFLLRRLERMRPRIEAAGHSLRFAVARGPLNIAAFLMGASEFLMALRTEPDQAHRMLDTITCFLEDWLRLQKERIDTIDGILLLDDIVGFLGEEDFKEFAKPYVTRAFAAFEASVRFFHNDAHGLVCAPHLADMGINLFNFGYDHTMPEMQRLTGGKVTLLGNIPPRDVLAKGTPAEVAESVRQLLDSIADTRRVILSCGGGMPPGVSTENIEAFLNAVIH